MDIFHTIENVEKCSMNIFIKDIVVESITVYTKCIDYELPKKANKNSYIYF